MSEHAYFASYGITYQWNTSKDLAQKSFVLEDVSFDLSRGEILTLLGPNGSGKSTLLKILSGIISIQRKGCSGQVKFRGQDFLSLPLDRRAQQIAYVGSELRTEFPLTVVDVVSLGRVSHNRGLLVRLSHQDQDKIDWALEKCLCQGLKSRRIDTLSGGERQLVALACGLAQSPRILLLDESLSKMDLNHQVNIGRMLKGLAAEGLSIILVSHDLNLALEWSQSALLLNKGQVIGHGPLDKVVTQAQIEKMYPGANGSIGTNPATGKVQVFYGG